MVQEMQFRRWQWTDGAAASHEQRSSTTSTAAAGANSRHFRPNPVSTTIDGGRATQGQGFRITRCCAFMVRCRS